MNERDKERLLKHKGKLLGIVILVIIIIFLIAVATVYCYNSDFRNFMDNNILSKELQAKDIKTLQISNLDAAGVIAYNDSIGILKNNQLEIYDSDLNEQARLDIKITNLTYHSTEKYAVLAEQGGQKVYLIKEKQIVWEESLEGTISSVHVNKNGYVAVTTIGTSHKTVIAMYDPTGKKIFNTYLSKTVVSDVVISRDNKYLAFAEIDATGAVIESKIKEVSLAKITENPEAAIEKVFECDLNALVTNIAYTNKNEIICMYADKITLITDAGENVMFDLTDINATFQSIDILNTSVVFEEQSTGIFSAKTVLNISDGKSGTNKTYEFDDVITQIETSGNVIAAISNNKIQLIDTRGWLVKRYTSTQEILKVVLSESISGIVYKDRIELIKF